ncbi:hypothetical protein, partial [Klebsiella pneumoniae]
SCMRRAISSMISLSRLRPGMSVQVTIDTRAEKQP